MAWEADSPAEEHIDLRGGGAIRVRRIRPEDAPQLREMHERLSPTTRRLRFFAAIPHLSADLAEHLCNVDFHNRYALVACEPEDSMLRGVGRYERTEANAAEVAFVVEDYLQGRGVGSGLLKLLAGHARHHGIERFLAVVLPENRQMLEVFLHSGFPCRVWAGDGATNVEMDITRGEAPPAL